MLRVAGFGPIMAIVPLFIIEAWYDTHQSDTMATIAKSLYIDDDALSRCSVTLLPIVYDAIESPWLSAHIREMLRAFYTQPTVQNGLALGRD